MARSNKGAKKARAHRKAVNQSDEICFQTESPISKSQGSVQKRRLEQISRNSSREYDSSPGNNDVDCLSRLSDRHADSETQRNDNRISRTRSAKPTFTTMTTDAAASMENRNGVLSSSTPSSKASNGGMYTSRTSSTRKETIRRTMSPSGSDDDSEYSKEQESINEDSHDNVSNNTDYQSTRGDLEPRTTDEETLSTMSKYSTKSHLHALDTIKRHTKRVKWRGVKFISSHESMAKFLVKLKRFFVDEDTNNPAKAYTFYTRVERSVQSALTEKRSAAAQAGAKKCIARCKELEDIDRDMYTVEEIQSLSMNQDAFYWFITQFVECVGSPKVWGRAKYHHYSTDTDEGGIQYKTTSDEAYALFIYENYFDKWMTEAKEEREIQTRDASRKRKDRKYTCSTSGGEKFGGLSHSGNMRYNQLLKMAKEDRVKETRRQSEDEVRSTFVLTPLGMEAKQREEARMKRIQRHELTSHKEKEDEQIDAMMEFYD